jgi:hypothetical protein
MTRNDLVELASLAEPQMMKSAAMMMALTERYDPDFAKDVAKEVDDILKTAEEGFDATMEKISAAPSSAGAAVKDFAKGFGISAATAIVGGLAPSIARDIYDSAKSGLLGSRRYDAIIRANPDLTKRFDRSTLRRSFGSLNRYAPEFMADPVLGGQLLMSVATSPETTGTIIPGLISARKSLVDTKARQFDLRVPGLKHDATAGDKEKKSAARGP